ncbi:hypothetical protein LTR08_005260 [Meristemomyces frigidus]|nr:hypothetical protein LTR08_005260 [Meristemomyces frigidus]
MSFSLSSLLNPEPAEAHLTEHTRKDSLPPIQHVQSPELYRALSSPQIATPSSQSHPHSRSHFGYAQEAAHALAASNAPPPTQYYGFNAPEYNTHERRTSFDHRSSGSHGAPIELPPPPPAAARKMSSQSPSLEAYHVVSRSPEQTRGLIISPVQAGLTLAPLQGFASAQQEQTMGTHITQSPVQTYAAFQPAQSHDARGTNEASVELSAVAGKDLNSTRSELAALQTKRPSPPPAMPSYTPLMAVQSDGAISSPVSNIKQEGIPTPRATTPVDARPSTHETSKAVASLKNEHGLRTQSPLRESSIPVPSTEMSAPEQPATSRKRPAKKGTASAHRRAPPSKKRKLEVKRSEMPSSRTSKSAALKVGSSKGTPANSSPAPSNRSYSAEPNEQPDDDDEEPEDGDGDENVYCLCRKPDNGTFMIGCDGTCDDWFHGKCVGIEERNKNLIDKYLCPSCTERGLGMTTYKRFCRRDGCRQPARVGSSKSGKSGSKYCSDECGVLYFRDMVAKTRNREHTVKSRGNRRKSSIVERPTDDDDLGAKGGALAAGEVKGLIDTSKTVEDFKKLGEGVLSPPATPDGKIAVTKQENHTESETHALEQIYKKKEDARRRHQLLKDRMKFVTMTKQAGSRTATEKELKPKEHCGYDPRLEWTEEQFATWRESAAGKQAFELDTLAVELSGEKKEDGEEDTVMKDDEAVYAQMAVCDRKKCARHLEWGKLAVDSLRFEMSDNSDNMRALDKEEREIEEGAAMRGKMADEGGAGSVEVHGLGVTANGDEGGKMEVDEAPVAKIVQVQQRPAPSAVMGMASQPDSTTSAMAEAGTLPEMDITPERAVVSEREVVPVPATVTELELMQTVDAMALDTMA